MPGFKIRGCIGCRITGFSSQGKLTMLSRAYTTGGRTCPNVTRHKTRVLEQAPDGDCRIPTHER